MSKTVSVILGPTDPKPCSLQSRTRAILGRCTVYDTVLMGRSTAQALRMAQFDSGRTRSARRTAFGSHQGPTKPSTDASSPGFVHCKYYSFVPR